MRLRLRKALATVSSLPAMVFIAAIRLYQKTFSPDHGPLRHFYRYGYCRHEPTCSEFGIQMLQTRSLLVALRCITKRILSCNPWTKVSEEKMKAMIARELQ